MLQPPVFTATPGVVPDMEDKEPINFFFHQQVLELIHMETTRCTNQYLERESAHLDTHPRARAHELYKAPLTLKEDLHGMLFSRSYWSKSWPFSSDNFSSLMSSRRFELILKFLHLNNSQTQPQRGEPGFDKLYKLQPLLDLLPSFKNKYTPKQFLSVDERMISFKGRLSFL